LSSDIVSILAVDFVRVVSAARLATGIAVSSDAIARTRNDIMAAISRSRSW
jgi:hypothetical protein